MTIEEMKKRKRELGYSNEQIAELTGIPYSTVQKIFGGITKAPRRETLVALEYHLSKKPELMTGFRPGTLYRVPEGRELYVREGLPAPDFPRQGQYTIDDYSALPDERRVELIDGVFYDMAAPTQIHQMILTELTVQLYPSVKAHPGCRLFFAPLDVRLDNDNFTMVQPDILIVCEKNDRDIRRINGAPDFIVEVLSPSNSFREMFRKLNKYMNAGVREYWVVDPEKRSVTVYDFEKDEQPETYSFADTVPLRISEGRCAVDFSVIDEALRQYD
ncbi:MAG: Uma2 family endonuclease [Lachnospiraceae bacterium]|nr:Uma2 family endonuclease [Lachnospiraceae bacterium]